MLNADYLCKQNEKDWKHAKKSLLRPTPTTQDQIILNTLDIQYKESNKNSEEKSRKSYRKLEIQNQLSQQLLIILLKPG